MTNRAICEELDHGIDVLVRRHSAAPPVSRPPVNDLLEVAAELRHMARPDFKAQLRFDLAEVLGAQGPRLVPAAPQTLTPATRARRSELDLASLCGLTLAPMSRANMAMSFAGHAAIVALLAASGLWMARRPLATTHNDVAWMSTEVSPYVLPPAKDQSGGGGGGGDRDKMAASKGAPPRFARQQFVPPTVVLRNAEPKVAMDATVVGPPNVRFDGNVVGDPLSKVIGPPSNGTGANGGIGTGAGGGVGSGIGAGVGPGVGGGYGGGAYRIGGGVSAPTATYSPDPEYSEEARKAKYQGVVVLWCVVTPEGQVRDVKVARSLGLGLDQKAIEAVKTWRFTPGMKDGVPVAVQINVEVSFRLY